MTTIPPCSVSPLRQGAALCHLTNGCRVSKFTCLSFYFSRNTCRNHTTCSCTSRRLVHYMRRVQTGCRMTRHSGRFVRLTTWVGYIYIYIILPDRHQPPATLRPIRRLPVRDQLFSGDSMPTPVSPDALRYILVGYNHNLVPYLLNGFPA